MNITELSIKRPTLIVVIFAVLTFLGVVSFMQLNYELLPKYANPVLVIATVYPGASPSEVENSITKKIEDAVSSLEQVDNIQSTSYEGMSVAVIIFKSDADMDKALRDAQRKVANIEYMLPKDSRPPIISNFSMDDIPIMRIGITADMSPTELYDLVKYKIQPMMSTIEGVSQIDILGGEEREVRINVDRDRLNAYGLSILQVTQAVQSSNMEFPTGKIKDLSQQYIIRMAGKFTSVADLSELVVGTGLNGSPVKLSDIAEIHDTQKDVTSISRIDGLNSVSLLIHKQPDGNEVEISKLVHKEIQKLEEIYKGNNVTFAIANDTSEFTLVSANAVMRDLLLAIALVALVMLVFLHSLRNSFIVMVAIPASLVSTFVAMYLLDFSLNIISLVAMSLVIGILVDDSIVVLENIYRHLEKGKDRRKAALDGRNEINYTALSITLVDVVVFLPIAIIPSMISGLLRQFALVVVVSTLLSLFVSFTLTPLLASRMAKHERFRPGSFADRIISTFERGLRWLTDKYGYVVAWSLRHKTIVLLSATVLFIGSVMLIPTGFIGSEFISIGDRGEAIINLEMAKNSTVEQTNQMTLLAEELIMKKPEVVSTFTSVGASTSFFEAGTDAYKSEIHIRMVDKDKRSITSDKFAELLKYELQAALPGVKVRSSIVSLVGTSDMDPIQMVVAGPDMDTLQKYAQLVMAEMKQVPGTAEVRLTVETGNPEVGVKLDKEKMARLGLNTANVGMTLQNAFSGNTDAKFRGGDNEYDINIVMDAFDRQSIGDISELTFVNNYGQPVRLNQFASIEPSTGATILQRYNRVPAITVTAQAVGRPVGSVGTDILDRLGKVKFPEQVQLIPEGDIKYQGEAFGSMGIAFLASILFVYLLMVALYDSYVYPFVVLFSIPLAVIGGLLALALTMQSLSIFSILGLIMLVGLVGKNAILLVDFANHQRDQGISVPWALVMAGKVRLRPILMTTLSMIFGMMPIALAQGAGSEWKNGMAIALIGGLTSSLLLTLIVVPVVYQMMDALKMRMTGGSRKKRVVRAG